MPIEFLSKDAVVRQLTESMKKSDMGLTTPADTVSRKMKEKYVLDETTEEMRNALLLYPGIANNTISYGRAAELLGMKKTELIKLYGKLGIPYLDMTDEEFEEEIRTVKRLANGEI